MDGQTAEERRPNPQSDTEAVAAVNQIAAEAGLTLQDWLSRTILDNARKSGIVVAGGDTAAAQQGEQSAEDAVQAIARHLQRAKASADAEGVSLAEWLSRAILANAKSDDGVPLARRYRPESPPAPPPAPAARPAMPEVAPAPDPPRVESPRDMPAPKLRPRDDSPPRRRSVLEREIPPAAAPLSAAFAAGDPPPLELLVPVAAAETPPPPARRSKALHWSLLAILVFAAGGLLAYPYIQRSQDGKAERSTPAPISTADATGAPSWSADPMPVEAPPAREPPAAPAPKEPQTAEAPRVADMPSVVQPAETPKPADPPKLIEPPQAADLPKAPDPPKAAEPPPVESAQPSAPPPPAETAKPQAMEPPPTPAESELAKVPAKDMPKPPSAHLDWYKRAANADNAEAQYALAELHLKGEGVAKDFRAAAQLFRRSADKGGLARSQYALGLLYARGIGVVKSDVEAVLWWQKAADQGHHAAITQVGIALMKGQGIGKNGDAARKMLERAAEADEVNAQYTLGRMYEQGESVKQDQAVAMKWFILAAEQAHPYATQKVEDLSTSLARELQERATELVSEHYRRFRKRS